MYLYAATVFLSAFLLFQVQPMIGKCILPWFGSSSSVWTTCMLLFQLLLLAGYGYAHLLRRFLPPVKQAWVHGTLLVAAVFTLPLTPHEPTNLTAANPTWEIMAVLLACVGATYTMISSTGPLMQAWFSTTHPGQSPYRLYALSNVGSLLALLSYPLLIEPSLTLTAQRWIWSVGFVLFAILAIVCAKRLATRAKEPADPLARFSSKPGNDAGDDRAPNIVDRIVWLLLSACGSVMLLAITNIICQDAVSVPMLWVAPLAIYLLTFILAFDSPWWYQRAFFTPALVISSGFMCWALGEGVNAKLWQQFTVYGLGVFFTCMSCHGELARHKPSSEHLTLYFLIISCGGALGGVFVAILAPLLFNGYWEMHGGIAATCFLVLLVVTRSWWLDRKRAATKASAPNPAWPLQYNVVSWLQTILLVVCFSGAAFLVASLRDVANESLKEVTTMERDYYGVLSIEEKSKGEFLADGTNANEWYRKVLMHGRIMHGFQYQKGNMRIWPTTYYSRESGIGIAIERHPKRKTGGRQFRLGVVGLGTGTAAVYAERDDVLKLYEINPHMVEFSNRHFSHVSDAKNRGAKVELFLGDARLVMKRQLENNMRQKFDVLAIDAFSGDAIPMHLLTLECFKIYFEHLDAEGILAVHVSNRYLELEPVVRQLAEDLGKTSLNIDFDEDDEVDYPGSVSSSTWVLVTANKEFCENAKQASAFREWNDEDFSPVRWTDDYSSLWPLIKWE